MLQLETPIVDENARESFTTEDTEEHRGTEKRRIEN